MKKKKQAPKGQPLKDKEINKVSGGVGLKSNIKLQS